MSAFDVYSVYLSVKAHFTTDKYDYFRYGGKTRTSEDKFNKRNDRYFFEKLGSKYTKKEIEEYFISNFLVNSNFYIKYMNEDNWVEWNRRRQSMTYLFTQDLESILLRCDTLNDALQCKSGQHPPILKMYLGEKIMIETLILLNRITKFVDRYDHLMPNDIIWKNVSKNIKKYDPFVNFDTQKAKQVILSKI